MLMSFSFRIFSQPIQVCHIFVLKDAEKQEIAGETAVTGGDALRLTCTVDRFPPFAVTWNKLGFNTTMINATGAVRLVIFNVTAEHSGQYICTVKLLNDNITEKVSITVKCKYLLWFCIQNLFVSTDSLS